jgi:hypothetical protein
MKETLQVHFKEPLRRSKRPLEVYGADERRPRTVTAPGRKDPVARVTERVNVQHSLDGPALSAVPSLAGKETKKTGVLPYPTRLKELQVVIAGVPARHPSNK